MICFSIPILLYLTLTLILDRGNYFSPLTDDVEVFNIHGEMSGPINDKLSFNGAANFYKYTLSKYDYAWNKPDWDGSLV